jgi:hypothetical protein
MYDLESLERLDPLILVLQPSVPAALTKLNLCDRDVPLRARMRAYLLTKPLCSNKYTSVPAALTKLNLCDRDILLRISRVSTHSPSSSACMYVASIQE